MYKHHFGAQRKYVYLHFPNEVDVKNLTCIRSVSSPLREHVKKKLAFLADASAKDLTPPPSELFADIAILCKFSFYIYKYIMFLKQEKPEMDDFERKKDFGFKGKFQ